MPARDVFLCHASPDKASIARPLAASLAQRAISCWLDEAIIEPGDSITDAVNDGLRLSRYVVVVVTAELLSRPWPRKELNAAFSREIRAGQVVVIPVLAVDHNHWADTFPLLADKLYLSWSAGADAVADAIASRFQRTPAADWACVHPLDWVGPVWIRCTPQSDSEHTLTLRWGPLIRRVSHSPHGTLPWSLVHHKTEADQVTLHVNVEPDAIVTFGQGPPPDNAPAAFNIDEGWVRASGSSIEAIIPPSGIPLGTDRSHLARLLGRADDPPL